MSGLRLLLDQMIDADVAAGLRKSGHDVCCVGEVGMSRADDARILEAAIEENRILVTLDEHFGDWAVLPLGRHPGVIRIKASPTTTRMIQAVLLPFLQAYEGHRFCDRLVIVRSAGIRWIQTPGGSD